MDGRGKRLRVLISYVPPWEQRARECQLRLPKGTFANRGDTEVSKVMMLGQADQYLAVA
jgi:hypothetical protein